MKTKPHTSSIKNIRKNAAQNRGTGPVTIGMVAQAAGVSASTVSRVLNGTAVVSDLKKQAIDEAIATLGFVPNPIARGLAGGRRHGLFDVASGFSRTLRLGQGRHRVDAGQQDDGNQGVSNH